MLRCADGFSLSAKDVQSGLCLYKGQLKTDILLLVIAGAF